MAGARNLTTYEWTDARTSKMIDLKKKAVQPPRSQRPSAERPAAP